MPYEIVGAICVWMRKMCCKKISQDPEPHKIQVDVGIWVLLAINTSRAAASQQPGVIVQSCDCSAAAIPQRLRKRPSLSFSHYPCQEGGGFGTNSTLGKQTTPRQVLGELKEGTLTSVNIFLRNNKT